MAQAVERTADNREVLGSNPSGPIFTLPYYFFYETFNFKPFLSIIEIFLQVSNNKFKHHIMLKCNKKTAFQKIYMLILGYYIMEQW